MGNLVSRKQSRWLHVSIQVSITIDYHNMQGRLLTIRRSRGVALETKHKSLPELNRKFGWLAIFRTI